MSDGIYVAKASFTAQLDGRRVMVRRGDTVREGHPLLGINPNQFAPIVVNYEHETPKPEKRKAAPKVEQATAAPGEVREVRPAAGADE